MDASAGPLPPCRSALEAISSRARMIWSRTSDPRAASSSGAPGRASPAVPRSRNSHWSSASAAGGAEDGHEPSAACPVTYRTLAFPTTEQWHTRTPVYGFGRRRPNVSATYITQPKTGCQLPVPTLSRTASKADAGEGQPDGLPLASRGALRGSPSADKQSAVVASERPATGSGRTRVRPASGWQPLHSVVGSGRRSVPQRGEVVALRGFRMTAPMTATP